MVAALWSTRFWSAQRRCISSRIPLSPCAISPLSPSTCPTPVIPIWTTANALPSKRYVLLNSNSPNRKRLVAYLKRFTREMRIRSISRVYIYIFLYQPKIIWKYRTHQRRRIRSSFHTVSVEILWIPRKAPDRNIRYRNTRIRIHTADRRKSSGNDTWRILTEDDLCQRTSSEP